MRQKSRGGNANDNSEANLGLTVGNTIFSIKNALFWIKIHRCVEFVVCSVVYSDGLTIHFVPGAGSVPSCVAACSAAGAEPPLAVLLLAVLLLAVVG